MTTQEKILDHGIKGFTIVADTSPVTLRFCKIIPLTDDVVVDAITFPESVDDVLYTGDFALEGVTLPQGVALAVFGTALTLTSGTVMLIRY